mmetsp:Transcript_123969/g.193507  ORF Transcript_123969/g.193507 Transcript_123969/m.193507 type:complete len:239 (-) Transcript_123969:181-897(-)
MILRRAFTGLVLSYLTVRADRASGSDGSLSMRLMKDGHFHLTTDLSAPSPGDTESIESKPAHVVDNRSAEPRLVSLHVPEQPAPMRVTSASSFANRTTDWLSLSHGAAQRLVTTRTETLTPKPTVPPERFTSRPKKWPERAWNEYQRAYQNLAPFRQGTGHTVASVAGVFLGPDSCILKILYVFFSMPGEDDYPYIPRGCGDMFDFALNANSIPVPWMLITGALLFVTGSHTTRYNLQ